MNEDLIQNQCIYLFFCVMKAQVDSLLFWIVRIPDIWLNILKDAGHQVMLFTG